nr:MAG TPA: hypothetical protein [Caudoviricetes sp.]
MDNIPFECANTTHPLTFHSTKLLSDNISYFRSAKPYFTYITG